MESQHRLNPQGEIIDRRWIEYAIYLGLGLPATDAAARCGIAERTGRNWKSGEKIVGFGPELIARITAIAEAAARETRILNLEKETAQLQKKYASLTDALEDLEPLAITKFKEALESDDLKTAVSVAKEIFDRKHGKATQTTLIGGQVNHNHLHASVELSRDDMKSLLERMTSGICPVSDMPLLEGEIVGDVPADA